MRHKSKNSLIVLIIFLIFGLSACKNESNTTDEEQTPKITETTDEITGLITDTVDQNDNFQEVNISAGGWEFIIEDTMRNSSMKNAATILGYTDTSTNEYEKIAPEGKEYFLIKMKITKKDSLEVLEWDNMTLSDHNGNIYQRIDDVFIADLDMKRMPGTDLNFGSNEGWIGYEIMQGATGLTIQYEFANDMLKYEFQ